MGQYDIVNFQHNMNGNNNVSFFLETTLQNKKDQGMANMMAVVNKSNKLALCDPMSVAAAIVQPTMLNLSFSIGEAYIIPYKNQATKQIQATMQISYKGLQALALRTGKYRFLNAGDVRGSEYIGKNHLTGEYNFVFIEDEIERGSKPIIGYLAHAQLLSGFTKTIFWTSEQLHQHFQKFSKNYDENQREWKGGLMTIDKKSRITMIKQILLSEGLPMTSELEQALEKDGTTFNEKGKMVDKINELGEITQEVSNEADKKDIKALLNQIGLAIEEKKLANNRAGSNAIINSYARSVGVDFGVTGGWYGISIEQLKLIAGFAETALDIVIEINGSRISQEKQEVEKDQLVVMNKDQSDAMDAVLKKYEEKYGDYD